MRWPLTLPALAGSLALALAAALVLVAAPRWRADAAEADQVLRQRARAAAQVPLRPSGAPADQRLVQALPPAAALPQRIGALVQLAQQHGVRLDSVRQSPPLRLGQGAAALDAERVPLRLAGSAPYSAWRQLAAQALQQDDALVLAELRLSRNSPAERVLAGTLQWSLLQRAADAGGTGGTGSAGGAGLAANPPAFPPALPSAIPSAIPSANAPASPSATQPAAPSRLATLPTRAADWPAPGSAAALAWQGAPEPPPRPLAAARPAAAAASAAAPVFPYRWIGQLDDGGAPQLLLASAQRSVGVRLGATLDGRWRLLRGPGGELLAQALPDGAPQAVPGAPPAARP